MIRRRLPALAFAAVLWPLAALGQTAQPVDKIAEQIKSQAIFCEGTYALCIKAPCVPIVTLDRLGNYYVDHFAEYMQARGYPHTPPAEMCVAVAEPKKSR